MSPLVFKATEERATPRARSLAEVLRERVILSGALPGPAAEGGPLIVFEESAYFAMRAAALADLRHEQVGIFYGSAFREGAQDWVLVSHAFRARNAEGTSVHVELDADAWHDVHAQARAAGIESTGAAVVGWFHTHPDLGAFFSGTDRSTQARAFPRSWQVGVVIDPVRGELGAFRGGDSEDIALSPLVLGRSVPRRPLMPAIGMTLPLPDAAPDLGAAAWAALGRARAHRTTFPPLTDAWREQGSALVFDRPYLKRCFPGLARELTAAAGRPQGWSLALPLETRHVAGVITRGIIRPVREIFSRSEVW